jgi:hypothetical protein
MKAINYLITGATATICLLGVLYFTAAPGGDVPAANASAFQAYFKGRVTDAGRDEAAGVVVIEAPTFRATDHAADFGDGGALAVLGAGLLALRSLRRRKCGSVKVGKPVVPPQPWRSVLHMLIPFVDER